MSEVITVAVVVGFTYALLETAYTTAVMVRNMERAPLSPFQQWLTQAKAWADAPYAFRSVYTACFSCVLFVYALLGTFLLPYFAVVSLFSMAVRPR